MTEPRYILLTIATIIVPDQRKPGTAQMSVIQPAVRKLFPLPLQITCEQNATPDRARAELEFPNHIMRTVELFDDVADALETGGLDGDYVVRPIRRDEIEAAAKAAVEIPADMTRIGPGSTTTDPDAVRWDGVVHTEGENTGKPVKQPAHGDLRIRDFQHDDGRDWVIEGWCSELQDGGPRDVWSRSAVPADILRPSYPSYEAAFTAIRVAGYARKLIP